MFLLNRLKSTLVSLGLYQKTARIVFLGLDNSGKSTLLMVLKENRLMLICPNYYPTSEEVVIGQIKYQIFDVGGQEAARRSWKLYLNRVDAVIFMVDASDRSRFDEAKYELENLLDMEELKNTPFVIFGNKFDSPYSASEEELKACLGFDICKKFKQEDGLGKKRPVGFFMCSAVKRAGYFEGFHWLSQFI